MAMILAGGKGERLYPLTKERAKSAVPYGGRYRIIDFVLSNFVNSGFFKVKILTQFKSESLNQHLNRVWRLAAILDQYVESVPAQMRTGTDWFKGSADAVYQNINLILDENPEYTYVFGGDHIYKMEVSQMLAFHIQKKADVTIAVRPVPRDEAQSFGIIEVDRDMRVIGFQEKHSEPKHMPGEPNKFLASMGNYIFTTPVLMEAVTADAMIASSGHDFGKNIIPSIVPSARVFAYDFLTNMVPGEPEGSRGYWRDVGSIESYFKASMDLVAVTPLFNLYNEEWPIRTVTSHLPPAKFVFADEEPRRMGMALDSLVAEGCILSGGEINRCILFPKVRINSYAFIQDSILMHGVNIGRHCRIQRAIVDKSVDIPPKTDIGYDLQRDKKRGFTVTDSGIVVIPKGTEIKS